MVADCLHWLLDEREADTTGELLRECPPLRVHDIIDLEPMGHGCSLLLGVPARRVLSGFWTTPTATVREGTTAMATRGTVLDRARKNKLSTEGKFRKFFFHRIYNWTTNIRRRTTRCLVERDANSV